MLALSRIITKRDYILYHKQKPNVKAFRIFQSEWAPCKVVTWKLVIKNFCCLWTNQALKKKICCRCSQFTYGKLHPHRLVLEEYSRPLKMTSLIYVECGYYQQKSLASVDFCFLVTEHLHICFGLPCIGVGGFKIENIFIKF